MGITLKDIYEQRDMLRRGEEIARAAKQAEERERLRDTFAAAALAGMLASGDDGSFSEESYARCAYRYADALLRVRDSRTADNTNLDVAPAARATEKPASSTACHSVGTDKAEPLTGNGGTGDTPGAYAKTDENRSNCDTARAALTDDERTALRIVSSVFPSEKWRSLLERLS